MHIKVFLAGILLLLLALYGCNSGESFSDGTRIDGPVIDGTGGSTVLDTDPSVPRVAGLLSAGAPLFNLGYRCAGMSGFTGDSGVRQERDAAYFVCPHTAREVVFFLGGENHAVELGRLWLPCESGNAEIDACDRVDGLGTWPDVNGESALGAPLVNLVALSDIVESPSRLDVASANSAASQRLLNASVMLSALDTGSRPGFITLHRQVHEVLNAGMAEDIAAAMTLPFEAFIARGGALDRLMTAVVDAGGSVGQVMSSSVDAGEKLAQKSLATAAGIYVLDMESYTYSFLLHFLGGLVPSVFPVTDALALAVVDAAINPETGEQDGFLMNRASQGRDYLPLFVVDRQGRAFGGGGYDVMDVHFAAQAEAGLDEDALPEGRIEYQCYQGLEIPDYLVLSPGAHVAADFSLRDFHLVTLKQEIETSLTLSGRLFAGKGFHGVTRAEVGRSDYRVIYPYPAAYPMDVASDGVRLDGVACAQRVDDLMVNSFYRVGLVEPFLDAEVMETFFGAARGPGAYRLRFWYRDTPSAEDFAVAHDQDLPITIHRDGSIFTNLHDSAQRNAGYDSDPAKNIPDGEYLIGLVTSIHQDDTPSTPGTTGINILLNLSGPPGSEQELRHFGKRLQAQLRPAGEAGCENLLHDTGDPDQQPVWIDTWQPLAAVDAIGGGTALQRYEILRTQGYGLLTGYAQACPDS